MKEGLQLKRVLSAWDLFFLGIGAIIGTGIFVLTGIAAANQAGPAVVLSFIVAGMAAGFAAFSYAELAGMLGGSGSAYGYARTAFGSLVGWLVGWILILEYAVAVSAVSTGWSGYFNNGLQAIGVQIPEQLLASPAAGGWINLPASLVIIALMMLLLSGAKQSARMNNLLVYVKLLAVLIFIVVGVGYVNPDNWTPFMPFGWLDVNADGKTIGVLAGASLVFFAYVGFDAISTAAEEARDPQRDLPKGILWSIGACSLVYVIVSGILTGMIPYPNLDVPSPVAYALQQVGVSWASALVATGAITGLTTVMLVLYYGLTRISYAMSRDRLLPERVARVSAKRQTPSFAIISAGVLMALMAGFVPLSSLAELVNIGTLTAFLLVNVAVLVLRKTHADMHRPFKIPFGATIPVLGIIFCGALISFLPIDTLMRFLAWLAIGLVVFFAYGRRRLQQLAAEQAN